MKDVVGFGLLEGYDEWLAEKFYPRFPVSPSYENL